MTPAGSPVNENQSSDTTISEVDMETLTVGELPGGPRSGPHWVKSTLSFANGNCVEVADLPDGGVGVRNSRDPGGPVLNFTPEEWSAFLGGVRNGEFDRFGANYWVSS
jgi:hypothetical protein